jgi:hypothetical protein
MTEQPRCAAETPEPAAPGADEMLIDRYLPRFDVTLVEHLVIDADMASTWRALQDLDLMQVHSPLLDAAFFVRGLPAKVSEWFGRPGQAPPPPELKLTGNGLGMDGWLSLGEVAGREIAFGAIGRFWRPNIEWYDVRGMTPQRFGTFGEPGWGRIAANFSLRPYGTARTLVSYEVRTATADPAAARDFARYWTLIRPFVGHIMKAALEAVRRDAERTGS